MDTRAGKTQRTPRKHDANDSTTQQADWRMWSARPKARSVKIMAIPVQPTPQKRSRGAGWGHARGERFLRSTKQGRIGKHRATLSPHAGDGEGTERALTTHLPCRGLAELVRHRGVAAPAKRARGGSVTLHPAEHSGCAGYGRTSGKIGIVHAAPRAGAGGLTGLRPNSHCAGFVTNSKIPSGNLNPGSSGFELNRFFISICICEAVFVGFLLSYLRKKCEASDKTCEASIYASRAFI